MKSRLFLLLATLLSTSAFANSVSGPYAGLKLGFTDYRKSTLPVQYGINVGYTFNINPTTTLDIEFSASELGDSLFFRGFTPVYYTTDSYSAVLKPKHHFLGIDNQPAYMAAIFGVSKIKESRKYYIGEGQYHTDRDQDNTGIYGFEVGSQITHNFDFTTYFHYQKANMFGENNYYRSYGMGFNYRF